MLQLKEHDLKIWSRVNDLMNHLEDMDTKQKIKWKENPEHE
jgi:hypothetical protein